MTKDTTQEPEPLWATRFREMLADFIRTARRVTSAERARQEVRALKDRVAVLEQAVASLSSMNATQKALLEELQRQSRPEWPSAWDDAQE